ncbi:TetR/AcrR family transcriptional regulator [Sphingomonas sp. GM_Shp_1]|uniref:TetR/AcrR family transcriptional regulator n=1 Tax=Sphingomonas sp. GM_Shp_1 TaxID=2937381 RepID=UPI00226BB845|nr:TetR/AcrR family transcriptional regulator [Sphingomonas sp. GM_Shp_1]
MGDILVSPPGGRDPVPRSRGRPSVERAAEIGHLVVEAAIIAFVEQGLDISIDQIAQSVGVSKQAVYRRWSSKISLLMDVMDRVMETVHFRLADGLPRHPVLALKELSWRMCRPDGGVRERSVTILMSEALNDKSMHQWFALWRKAHFDFYRAFVLTAARSVGREEQAMVIARILLDMVEGVSRATYWENLSDADCAALFSQKWDRMTPMLR